jgi:hypothetical protein
MRSLLLVAVAVIGLFSCEQHYSSNPPSLAPESFAPASSSGAIDALLAPSTTDAGAVALDSSHALTVTICSASPLACPTSAADASAEVSYHVVFGSGRGVIRSRGQAMADLYNELRDRTASGERIDANARAPNAAGSPAPPSRVSRTKASAGSSDAIAKCALQLLDLVDGVGEVTLDVIYGSGSSGCMVSLGRFAADGGASQCLVQEPEGPHRPGGGGIRF